MAGALGKKNGTMMRKGGVYGDPAEDPRDRNQRRVFAKRLAKTIASHPCAGCTACCTVKEIKELAKEAGEDCANIRHAGPKNTANGCSIYRDRPDECRDYFCGYNFGLVGDTSSRRPDKCGLLFEIVPAPPPDLPGVMLSVREVWPDAIDQNMKELNELVASKGIVLYLHRGESRFFMGPEERVKICHEWSRRKLPLIVQ